MFPASVQIPQGLGRNAPSVVRDPVKATAMRAGTAKGQAFHDQPLPPTYVLPSSRMAERGPPASVMLRPAAPRPHFFAGLFCRPLPDGLPVVDGLPAGPLADAFAAFGLLALVVVLVAILIPQAALDGRPPHKGPWTSSCIGLGLR